MITATNRKRTQRHALISFILSLIAGLFFFLFSAPAFATIAPDPTIPTTAIEWEQQAARIPDWSRISFRTLPPVASDGAFDATPEASQAEG